MLNRRWLRVDIAAAFNTPIAATFTIEEVVDDLDHLSGIVATCYTLA